MKRVFSLMTHEQRDRFAIEENPFVSGLEQLIDKFVIDCRYYGTDAIRIEHFLDVYTQFKDSTKNKDSDRDQTKTVQLMRQLTQQFIPITFQENSYLQEDLVNIYKALDEMLVLSNQARMRGTDGAEELYGELLDFQPKLQASIERGHRSLYQMEIPTALRCIFTPLLGRKTIASHTWEALQKLESLQDRSEGHGKLDRSVRDLKELYYSTRESEMSCVVFVAAVFVFWFSIIFSIFRLVEIIGPRDSETGYSEILWVRTILNVAAWASLVSLLGAFWATTHFIRKLRYLLKVYVVLGQMNTDHQVRRIRTVTRSQQLLTIVRLLAVLAASVALPWSAAVSTFGSSTLSGMIPVYIATGALCAVLAVSIFCFLVEITIRYNLDPCLGHIVCEPLRDRIADTKLSFSGATFGDIETTQKLEKEAWEYTAREFLQKYRFDVVFGADRFGAILQYLQSGNRTYQA